MYILILIYVTLVFYTILTWKYDFWKKKKIPFANPELFYGSIKAVIKGEKHFGVLFREWYRLVNQIHFKLYM